METRIFNRPRRNPPTAPRSCYLESVLRGVPLERIAKERNEQRILELIKSRRDHRNNRDIDDLQAPPKSQAQTITIKSVSRLLPGFSPKMFKTEEEINLERWKPVFKEAFNRMASINTLVKAIRRYNAASNALIDMLNRTIDAAEIALADRENAPPCLIEEMEQRLIHTASAVSEEYQDKTDELNAALDGFFDYTEQLNERGELLFSCVDAAAFLGIDTAQLKELKNAGILHPIKLSTAECCTRSDLEEAARKLYFREIGLERKEPKKKAVDAENPTASRKARRTESENVDLHVIKGRRGRPRKKKAAKK